MVAVALDPSTLAPQGEVALESVDLVGAYGTLLEGDMRAASASRIAASPDGSTVVLWQPDRIDVLTVGG